MLKPMDTAILPRRGQTVITVRLAAPIHCPHCSHVLKAADIDVADNLIIADCSRCGSRLLQIEQD